LILEQYTGACYKVDQIKDKSMEGHPQLVLGPLVGGLSDKSANVWGRANGPGTLHAWLGRQPDLSDAALSGKSTPLTAEDAFAGIVNLDELQPSTLYHYTLSLTDSQPDPQAGPYPSFKTFPEPGKRESFTFAFGSCFRPRDASSGQIFRALDRQRITDDLRFIFMIGDQIYADQWKYNSLGHVAITLDDYREVYKYVWSRLPFRETLTNLPVFMTLDDHEVDNDWHWDDLERRWAHIPFYEQFIRWINRRPKDELYLTIHRVRDALQAYWEHQGIHAPPYIHPPKMDRGGRFVLQKDIGTFAYTLTFGAAAFFVMDTRTMRTEGKGGYYLLGEPQWQQLEAWLLDVKDKYPVKFLVTSSSVLFDMIVDFALDRWNGFVRDRERLFDFIAANKIEDVYLLSGDLHSAHAISADLKTADGSPLCVWELCATPFEQDTNIAKSTYFPPRIRAIKKQKLHFSVAKHNYGVVGVKFPEEGRVQVTYTVYGSDGVLLRSVEANG
jgi:phosphodiesterase/alkaline phosphatase D-like protein